MSTATRLGDWGGQRHVGEQAEAGGALQLLEPCGAVSIQPARCPSLGPARPSKRPSLVVTWLLCANAAGRCHERLGGTSGNPPATARTIGALCIVRAYSIHIPEFILLLYGGSTT